MSSRPKCLSGIQCLRLMAQLPSDDSGDSGDSKNTSDDELNRQCQTEDGGTSTSDLESGPNEEESVAEEDLPQSSNTSSKQDAEAGSKKRKRAATSDSRPTEPAAGTETGRDGTQWHSLSPGLSAGRLAQQNVLKEIPCPSAIARQKVREASFTSAFKLIVDNSMMKHIQACTQREARERSCDHSWTISLEELDAFLAIIIARGAFGSSKHDAEQLWDTTWGPQFFRQTMPRNRYREIMRYLRFDDNSQCRVLCIFCNQTVLLNLFFPFHVLHFCYSFNLLHFAFDIAHEMYSDDGRLSVCLCVRMADYYSINEILEH